MKQKRKRVLPFFVALCMIGVSGFAPLASMPVYAQEENVGNIQEEQKLGEQVESFDDEALVEDENPEESTEEPQESEEKATVSTDEPESENKAEATAKKSASPMKKTTPLGIEDVRLVVSINGTNYDVTQEQSLADAITENIGTTLSQITSVKFVSGTVTAADLEYFKTNKSELTALASIGVDLNSGLIFTDASGAQSTRLPNNIWNVNFGLTSLTTVSLAGFTELGNSALKINSLTTLNIPDVTVVGDSTFSGCARLKSVDMSGFLAVGDRAFEKTGLTSVTVSSHTRWGSQYGYVFAACTSLVSADLFDCTQVPARMFYGCTGLKTVNMPNVHVIGDNAFYNCRILTLTEDDFRRMTSIGGSAFYNAVSLSGIIEIPQVTSLGSQAFYNCSKITGVVMPKVTSIGAQAFYGCTALTQVDMPKVESIGDSAFASIKTQMQVAIGSNRAPSLGTSVFANVKEGSTVTVAPGTWPTYVPEVELGALVQTAPEWGGGLTVSDPEYVTIDYTDNQSYHRYQVLKKGTGIGDDVFRELQNDGYQLSGIYTDEAMTIPSGGVDGAFAPEESQKLYLKFELIKVYVYDASGTLSDTIEIPAGNYNQLSYTGNGGVSLYPELPAGALYWNTAADGSGRIIEEDTKIYQDLSIYPILTEARNIGVKVNGQDAVYGATLGRAVNLSGVRMSDVTSIEIVGGKVTADDFAWIKTVGDTLERWIIEKGVVVENDTLPAGTFLKKTALNYLELHGVKTVETAAFYSCEGLNTVILPDVMRIGNNGLGVVSENATASDKMQIVEMPNVEVLETAVFRYQDQVQSFNFPKLRSAGREAFKGCGVFTLTIDRVPALEAFTTIAKGSRIIVSFDAYDAYVKAYGSAAYGGITLERNAVTVTYRIESGTWEDGTTDERTEVVPWGTAPTRIPTGMESLNEAYENGRWDKELGAPVSGDTVYTYQYEKTGYFLSYDINGGTGETPETEGVKKNSTGTVTREQSFMKEGAKFIGWSKTPFTEVIADERVIGNTYIWQADESVDMEGSDGTIYAVWAADANHNGMADFAELAVTFKIDNGVFTENNQSEITRLVELMNTAGRPSGDGTYTFKEADVPKFTVNEGYIFTGWNTKADGTGKTVDADTVVSADLSVYAIFEKQESPIVPAEMESVTATNGTVTVTLKEKPTDAPTVEDIKLVVKIGEKTKAEQEITEFIYDGERTIRLAFEPVEQIDEKQTFRVIVFLNGKSSFSEDVTVEPKPTPEPDPTPDLKPEGNGAKPELNPEEEERKDLGNGKDSAVKTGDPVNLMSMAALAILSLGVGGATLAVKRKSRKVRKAK